jgi:hypothetical protein
MEKKRYIAPMLEISAIEIACDILDVSTNIDENENKPGYGGEVGGGYAPAPEAGKREDWGGLW